MLSFLVSVSCSETLSFWVSPSTVRVWGWGADGLWRVLVALVASWVGLSQTNRQIGGSLEEEEQETLPSGAPYDHGSPLSYTCYSPI